MVSVHFSLKAKQFLVQVLKFYLKLLLKLLPKTLILWDWVFDNFILAEEPFAKALRSLETCVFVNNNFSGNQYHLLKSPTAFDENFIADFNY